MIGILEGHDQEVAKWIWSNYRLIPMPVNRCFGLMVDGQLVGGFVFQNYNGINVDFSFYGKSMITAGIVKYAIRVALNVFKVERATFYIPRNEKRRAAWLKRFGCIHEGNCRRYYGRTDGSKDTAMRFAIFRENLEKFVHRPTVH
jgi:hypothetical protein